MMHAVCVVGMVRIIAFDTTSISSVCANTTYWCLLRVFTTSSSVGFRPAVVVVAVGNNNSKYVVFVACLEVHEKILSTSRAFV